MIDIKKLRELAIAAHQGRYAADVDDVRAIVDSQGRTVIQMDPATLGYLADRIIDEQETYDNRRAEERAEVEVSEV